MIYCLIRSKEARKTAPFRALFGNILIKKKSMQTWINIFFCCLFLFWFSCVQLQDGYVTCAIRTCPVLTCQNQTAGQGSCCPVCAGIMHSSQPYDCLDANRDGCGQNTHSHKPQCLNELPRGDNRPFYIFIFQYCSYLMAKLIDQVITRSDFRNLQFGSWVCVLLG